MRSNGRLAQEFSWSWRTMTSMKIGGGEETEKESSGGFKFEEEELTPCFEKEKDVKVAGLPRRALRPLIFLEGRKRRRRRVLISALIPC